MKRAWRVVIELVVAVLVISVPVGLVMVLKARGVKERPEVQPRRSDVEVVTVQLDTLEDRAVLPAAAACPEDRCVKLAAEIPGKVVAVHKQDGDAVEHGEVILEIDTESLKAQLAEAKAGYDEARLRYNRLNQLFESRHVSEDQVDTARAAFERSAAQVRLAEVALAKGTVRSPIDGRVDRRYVDTGEFVSVGTAVADVVNITSLYAIVEVPERDRQYVHPGMEVAVTFRNVATANPGGPFHEGKAVVRSVSDMGDEMTRTFRAQVAFENPAGLVKPGMLGIVEILRRPIPGQVVVPKDFIVASEGEMLVYVAVGGRAVARRVELGLTDGIRFQVITGVRPGELIVRDPRRLTPGELIQIRSLDGKEVAQQP